MLELLLDVVGACVLELLLDVVGAGVLELLLDVVGACVLEVDVRFMQAELDVAADIAEYMPYPQSAQGLDPFAALYVPASHAEH